MHNYYNFKQTIGLLELYHQQQIIQTEIVCWNDESEFI